MVLLSAACSAEEEPCVLDVGSQRTTVCNSATLCLSSCGNVQASKLRPRVPLRGRGHRPAPLSLEDTHAVVIGTPGMVTGLHTLWILHLLGEPLPRSLHVLTMGERRLLLRRTDAWTLELSAVGQALLDQPQEVLFRPPPQALAPADTADVGLFRATVLQDRPGVGIGTVQFRFDRPLEHALVFLAGGPGGLEPFELPAVGKAVMVPAPVLPEDPPG